MGGYPDVAALLERFAQCLPRDMLRMNVTVAATDAAWWKGKKHMWTAEVRTRGWDEGFLHGVVCPPTTGGFGCRAVLRIFGCTW